MNQPKAIIIIRSNKEVAFKLRKVPYHHFCKYLTPFKQRFPEMKWNPCMRQWQLPVEELQPLYEMCRTIFQPQNVYIVGGYYSADSQAIQLYLFDKEDGE